MIEFNETFDYVYSGKEAVKKRATIRLNHTTNDIPYYDRGVDVEEFKYGSQIAAIKLGLRDFGPEVKYDGENNRVQIYNVSIDVNNLVE